MQDELSDMENKKKAVIQKRDRLVKLAAEGTLSNEEVGKQIQDIRERLISLQDTIDVLERKLGSVPDIEQMNKRSLLASRVLIDVLQHPGEKAIDRMLAAPFEKQRKLIEYAFAGKDIDGNRLGVYVEKTDDPTRPWRFEIRAILDQVIEFYLEEGGVTSLPLSLPRPTLPVPCCPVLQSALRQ